MDDTASNILWAKKCYANTKPALERVVFIAVSICGILCQEATCLSLFKKLNNDLIMLCFVFLYVFTLYALFVSGILLKINFFAEWTPCLK